MADIDYNALGQAIDTTFGRSSTPRAPSFSVKFSMLGPDRLLASYAALVNFGTERQMIDMKRMYEDESKSVVAAVLKDVKSTYKDLCGESLTAKEISAVTNLEMVNMSPFNPRRTAYYRLKTVFEIG